MDSKRKALISTPKLTKPLMAKDGTHPVTADWLLAQPNLILDHPNVKWLDESNLIYALPPMKENKNWEIYTVDTRTHENTFLTEGFAPNPSPDGRWISFVRGQEDEKQLWIIRKDGTNLKRLTDIKGGIGKYYQFSYDFAWSPDSKFIALSYQPHVDYWKDEARPDSSIFIINRLTCGIKKLASFSANIRDISWLPNSNEILFMKERVGILYKEEADYTWVQTLNIHSGNVQTVAQFDGLQQFLQPTASPDGKIIALMYDADNPIFNFMPSIGLIHINEINDLPSINRLTYELKLDSPKWSNSSTHILVRRDYGAYKQIYSISLNTGEVYQITDAPLNIENFALSPNGLQLAWVGQDAHGTRIIRTADSNGQNIVDLIIMHVAKNIELSEVREIAWNVPDYPAQMRGLLILPLKYDATKKYPLIIDIHGGDSGAHIYLMGGLLVTSPLEWQMWATKGYVVFIPEFRSSASFGYLAISRDHLKHHNRIDCDIKDIEAGVDYLIASDIIDSQRMAVIGHSVGAVRANWLAVTTHRYKAVVSKEGWADELLQASNFPASRRIFTMYGGSPQEVPQNYLKNSALAHSKGATTPTLFIMGNPELGGVDPAKTSLKLYQALKGQSIETQYIEYLDEGHNIEQAINRQDVLKHAINWIDTYLCNK